MNQAKDANNNDDAEEELVVAEAEEVRHSGFATESSHFVRTSGGFEAPTSAAVALGCAAVGAVLLAPELVGAAVGVGLVGMLSAKAQEEERDRAAQQGGRNVSMSNPPFDIGRYRRTTPDRAAPPPGASETESLRSFALEAAEHCGDKIPATTVTSLIDAMYRYPDDVDLQTTGCRVLRYLARHDHHTATIKDAQGIEAVLCAMTLHPGKAELQESAIRTIGNMCCFCTPSRLITAHVGGINSIVVSMHRFPENAEIQEAACGTLANLSGNVESTGTMLSSGGACAIVSALQNHVEDSAVQASGFRSLSNLLKSNKSLLRRPLDEMGATQAVRSGMMAHPDDNSIRIFGERVLSSLETSSIW